MASSWAMRSRVSPSMASAESKGRLPRAATSASSQAATDRSVSATRVAHAVRRDDELSPLHQSKGIVAPINVSTPLPEVTPGSEPPWPGSCASAAGRAGCGAARTEGGFGVGLGSVVWDAARKASCTASVARQPAKKDRRCIDGRCFRRPSGVMLVLTCVAETNVD